LTELNAAQIADLVASVPHWHHMMTLPHGIRTPGAYDPRDLFSRLRLPDLAGKRVLDVGARDGFFSFECEERGAEVLALDHADPRRTGFDVAKRILGSRVEYVRANVYDLRPEELGHFDVVLFLGVLYHLRHPLLALDRLRRVCKELLVTESLVCDASFFTGFQQTRSLASFSPELTDLPLAQFLSSKRFHPDWTNKWAPNVSCLKALLEDALFQPTAEEVWGDRALIHARPVEDPDLSLRARLDAELS
jgi:tRNA (mo5U34)-methyltransferase